MSDKDVAVVVNVAFDGMATTPAEAAAWVEQFLLERGESRGPATPSNTLAAEWSPPRAAEAAPRVPRGEGVGIDAQLKRLTDFAPTWARFVRRAHEGLTELGYVATLPAPRKSDRLPSYIAYIDPATGKNLGNINSAAFYVMRRELRDELAGQPHVKVDSRYAHISLTGDAAVDLLLELARAQKA